MKTLSSFSGENDKTIKVQIGSMGTEIISLFETQTRRST